MRRLLSYITLLVMMAMSVVTGQWNEWSRRPDWSHLMRHLVPQDNLALFVNPGAQMIDGAKGNSQYPALKTSEEIVQNADFHDFTIDYPSVGEPDPFYESDFKDGTDGWNDTRGTITGNVDGIDGEDDVISFWADNSTDGYHYIFRSGLITENRIYRITGKVYIPSGNTNVNGVQIGNNRASDGYQNITTTGSWINFECEINNTRGTTYLYLFALKDGNKIFAGANSSSDDLFYVKDIKVQRVGLVAWWQFDSYYNAQEGTGKTILQDLSGNGYDLTASGGFDWQNQLTGDDPVYRNGNALEFDGVDDEVHRSDVDFMGDKVSWFFWAKPVDVDINMGLITNGGDGYANGFRILYRAGVYKRWRMQANFGDASPLLIDKSDCEPNVYYFVGFTYDGSILMFYINGVSVGTISDSRGINYVLGNFYIGYNGLGCFQGNIVASAYFNRALSATEVKALYGKPKYWTWNETGSIANNNFKAELSGGAELSQDITVDDETLYKEQKISTTDNDVGYFGNTTSYTVTIGDGTWSYAGVKDVTNVSAPDGTTVIDYSGNGNNGIAQGGLETNQPIHPYAWEFDGVDDYEKFNTGFLQEAHSHIVWCWFKTYDAYTGFTIWAEQTDDLDLDGQRAIVYRNQYRFYYGNGSSANPWVIGDVQDNNWYFMAYVVDEAVKMRYLYVNGELIGSTTLPASYAAPGNNLRWWNRNENSYSFGLNGEVGAHGQYIFDGQDGRASVMPSNYYQRYIQKIYNNTRRYFQ